MFIKVSYIIRLSDGRWRVCSEAGRNLGTYKSKKAAEERLRQIEMFKHMDKKKKRKESLEQIIGIIANEICDLNKVAEKIDVDNLKKKYPDLSEEINSLISSDPSGRNIYLLWSIKQLLKDFNINDIIPTIKLFHENKQSLNKKDINQYSSLKELEDTIKERLEKRQTRKEEIKGKLTEKEVILKQLQELQEKEENIIKTGTELIAETEDHSITLRFIKEKSASQLLGKDASWGISMCKPGATYYEQYISSNVCFYFLENKSIISNYRLNPINHKHKIIIAVQRDTDNKIIKTKLYDKTDNIININELDKTSQDFVKIAEQDASNRPKGMLARIKNKEATKEEVLKIINIYNNPKSQDILKFILRTISYNNKYKDILSEPFIREFKDYVNWFYISRSQKLSESFIKEFKNKVDWNYISHYQKLSETFIREFKNYVNWDIISYSQKLSEAFIREFENKVNWDTISYHQKLSPVFRKEFKHKLNITDTNRVEDGDDITIIKSYSSIMRDLNRKSPEKVIPFMNSFKKAFDEALSEDFDNPEEIALLEALQTIGEDDAN